MKTQLNIINKVFVVSLVLLWACGGDDGPGPDLQPTLAELQAEVTTKLTGAGAWTLSGVTRDGVDVESEFSGFTVTFTASGFTTSNGSLAWDNTGTWSFQSGSSDTIIRDDNVTMLLVFSNNDSQLNLSFNVPNSSLDIGKVAGIAGNYVFELIK